jgi:hypothetical protein
MAAQNRRARRIGGLLLRGATIRDTKALRGQ